MGFWPQGKSKKLVYGVLAIFLVALLFTAGCGGGGSSGSSDSGDTTSGTDTVTISGEFENGSYAKNNLFNKLLPGFLPSAHAFDPSTVSKVLAFFGNGKHVISEVTEDGDFSINVAKGSPIGMIFVGENDNYLGYLTLGNGIDTLPLHYNEENIATIDLETLSSSDKVVQSSANVLKNKFQLSQEEQNTLGYADNLFASIVKNPDVDDNGTLDFLEGKFFSLHLYYYYYGGNFVESHENGLTPKVNDPSDIWNGFKFGIRGGADWPENIYFYGPEGSSEPVIDPPESQDRIVFDTHTYYYSSYVDDHDFPPKGVYTVDYKIDGVQKTLKFNVPDQSGASENTVLAIPTVELNDDRTINKVTWVYRAAKENAFEVDPKVIIDKVELQIAGTGVECEDYIQENRMYNSGNLPGDTTEHVLECQNLLWDKVTGITMGYEDVYGNSNAVGWQPK